MQLKLFFRISVHFYESVYIFKKSHYNTLHILTQQVIMSENDSENEYNLNDPVRDTTPC